MPTITSNVDVAIGLRLVSASRAARNRCLSAAPVPVASRTRALCEARACVKRRTSSPLRAALHRRHAHDRLGFAVLAPAPANRGDQPVEIRSRRGLLAGELGGRDRVARLAEGHDFAVEMPGSESFGHVFRQGTAEVRMPSSFTGRPSPR